MRTISFSLAISADDYLRFYQCKARNVLVRADGRRRIEFLAEYLRPLMMHDGIHGRFELVFDEMNKFVELRKI